MRTATWPIETRVGIRALVVLPHLDSHREPFLSDDYSGDGNNFPRLSEMTEYYICNRSAMLKRLA